MLKSQPLVPKNPDGPLRVLVIGRVSTLGQEISNIDASYKYVEELLRDAYDGPIDIKFLGEQGSGMLVERATILEAIDDIATGTWDVLLMEDVSKPYRNPRWQHAIVQDAVDAEMRVIAPGDSLDTGDENWEVAMGAATLRHSLHIPDTRRRIRRTADYSFHRGGMVLKVKFGYRKLTKGEAESGEFGPKGLREAKVARCTPILHDIRRRLLDSRRPPSVIDWLKNEDILPGPYVKNGWTVPILKKALCDPKLHGWRLFRRIIHRPIFRTGKHKRVKNGEPEREYVPELAHMSLEEQESMLAAVGWELDWGNTEPKRKSSRKNVRRSQSIWPGQAATCSICEGPMLIYGDFLKCKGSQKENGETCWNRVQVDLQRTRDVLLTWLLKRLDNDSDARRVMIDAAWQETQQHQKHRSTKFHQIQKEIIELEKQEANLSEGVALGGNLNGLLSRLKSVEVQLVDKRGKLENAIFAANDACAFHAREDVDAQADDVLKRLLATSFDFADVMREFFPVFVIHPIHAIDSGQLYPRGKLRFRDTSAEQDLSESMKVELDLFKIPDRILLMPKAVAARSRTPKPTYRQIALELGTSCMTVKRCLAFERLMDELGVIEPFVEISEKPDKAPRWGPRTRKTK